MRTGPIVVVTGGTRGDVDPLAALAMRLRDRGHRVTVVSNPTFLERLARLGLDVVTLGDSPADQVIEQVASRTARMPWPFGTLREILSAKPGIAVLLDRLTRIAGGSAAVVCSDVSSLALHAADAVSVPCVYVRLNPVWPTRRFPPPVIPFTSLGAPLNLAAHVLWQALLNCRAGTDINRWRRARRLPRWQFERAHHEVARRPWPLLFAFSRALVPLSPDWPARAKVTGFWFLDDPSPAVPEALLAGEGRLIVVSAGCNSTLLIARLADAVRGAAGRMPDVRWLVPSAFGDTARVWRDLPANVRLTGFMPYAALLARADAIIHHGGAGTAAWALAHGVPSITVPFHSEQRFWAHRLAERGLGTRPLDWRRITATKVVDAASTVTGVTWPRTQLDVARQTVMAEAGVNEGVEEVEMLL
jgi:sterol 3beta-glucosyltransferase